MLKDLKIVSYPNHDAVELQFTNRSNSNTFLASYTDENNNNQVVEVNNTYRIITNLQPNTVYTLKTQNNCGENLSPWSDSITIRTPQIAINLPFIENFEDPSSNSKWTFIQGAASNDSINKWFIGTASHKPTQTSDKYALYVDSLDGSSNFATNNQLTASGKKNTIVHAYRDIEFPETNNDIRLSFDWRGWGTYDKPDKRVLVYAAFIVSIVDLEKTPNEGFFINDFPQIDLQENWSDKYPTIYQKTMYAKDDVWHDTTIFLPAHLLSGKKKRLVYTWYNYVFSKLRQPPTSIDNIKLVASQCPTPKNITYTQISHDSVKLQWECDANPIADNFTIQYNSDNYDNTTHSTSNKSIILSKLKENTVYQGTIVNECKGMDNTPVSFDFRTPQLPTTLPFSENFSNLAKIAEWTFINGTKLNRWYAGTPEAGLGEEDGYYSAAYISSDEGYSNVYATSDPNPGTVHLYKEIAFPDESEFMLSFDWRCMGESSYDFMSVYLADNNVIPVTGTDINSTYNIFSASGRFNLQSQWRNELILLDGSKYKNTKKKLIFSWKNSNYTGTQPPAAFTNLSIEALDCVTPKNLHLVKCPDATSAIIAWDTIKNINNYLLRYREIGTSANYRWDTIENIEHSFYTIKNLKPNNIPYEVQVKNICGEKASWTKQFAFNTQQTIATLPFKEDFEEITTRKNWTIINGDKLNRWHIDTAVHDAEKTNYAAYISDNGGSTNSYTETDPMTSLVHIYRDIQIQPDQKEFQMTFDWKGLAQGYYSTQTFASSYDFLNVYLVNEDSIPIAGIRYSDSARIFYKNFHSSKVWETEQIILPLKSLKRLKGERNRIVFMWYNSASTGNQPPIAIDNIFVNTSNCLSPTILSSAVSTNTAHIRWKTNGEDWISYNLQYKEMKSDTWKEVIGHTDTSYTLRNLKENGVYEVRLQTKCANPGNTLSLWVYDTIKMRQRSTTIPFFENFEDESTTAAWTALNGSTYGYPINSWFIGKAAGGSNGSNNAAFISDSNGYIYRYEGYTPSVTIQSHLYRDIRFPAGVKEYFMTFDWKCMGRTNSAYLYASLIDSNIALTPGHTVAAANKIANQLRDSMNWNTWSGFLPGTHSGKTKKLIFSGYFISATAPYVNQPPPAVDNIRIIALDCKTPDSVSVVDYPNAYSSTITWANSAVGDTFTIAYRKKSELNWQYVGFKTKPATLIGLDSNTVYEIKVENSCGASVMWSAPFEIQTPFPPIQNFPFEETFDAGNANNWIVINGNATNQWFTGNVYDKDSTAHSSMFISNDNGVSNMYTHSASTVFFYKDIQFPTTGLLQLTFTWRGMGENITSNNYYDYLAVYADQITAIPIPNTTLRNNYYGRYKASQDWQTSSIIFPDTLKGKIRRLIFAWRNNGSGGENPPTAIDNILLSIAKPDVCGLISNIRTEAFTDKKTKITWNKGQSGTISYSLEHKQNSSTTWISQQISDTVCLLDNLIGGRTYNLRVRANCPEGSGKFAIASFMSPYGISFFENFTSNPPTNWERRNYLLSRKDTAVKLTTTSTSWGGSEFFANIPGGNYSIHVSLASSALKDWLITPPIYLDSTERLQMEFNLALVDYLVPEGLPNHEGFDDLFGIFVSTDGTWSINNNMAIWDNKGKYRNLNDISHTLAGSKIKLLLDKYRGKIVQFGFYAESTVNNASNKLFLDNLLISPYHCKEVTSIKVSDIGLDKATIKWNPASTEQYQWEVRYGLQSDPYEMESIDVVETNTLKLEPLENSKTYNVFVRAICGNLESSWKSISFNTFAPCNNINKESISVSMVDTSATISWGASNHIAWEFRYGIAGTNLNQMQKRYTTSPSLTINGLTEQTQYGYYLRGVCGVNDTSHWINQQFFTTQKTVCPGIFETTITDVTINSATITWTAPVAQTQWEVRYGSESININSMNSFIVSEKTLSVSKLQVNSTYDVVIRSICRADDSSVWSNRTQFRTKNCDNINNLQVRKNPNGTSAELSWTAKPEHTAWEIGIDENSDFSNAKRETTIENPYTIDYGYWNIQKTKSYYISVKANCSSYTVETWSDQVVLVKEEGIDDLNNSSIKVTLAPNPAKDFTKLSIAGAEGEVVVQLFSVKGELMITEKLTCNPESTKELLIKELQRGAYTIRIIHEKWTKTEKLIVQ